LQFSLTKSAGFSSARLLPLVHFPPITYREKYKFLRYYESLYQLNVLTMTQTSVCNDLYIGFKLETESKDKCFCIVVWFVNYR